MSDAMTFEALLDDAFERYLADAPVDVDAAGVAASVAAIDPGGRAHRWLGGSSRRQRQFALAFAIGLLVLALATAALIAVGRLQHRPLQPWSYRNELVSAGRTTTARGLAIAATLHDGRVLILTDSSGMATAEIYDPTTGLSKPTGPLVHGELLSEERVAVLNDGRVLLAGDARPADGPFYAVSQVFDPSTLSFTATGPEIEQRASASMSVLPDGRVLLIGGTRPEDPNAILSSAELYDPATNAFTATGSLARGRARAVAIALPDGKVLVAGGDPAYMSFTDGNVGSLPAELYDPSSGRFSTVVGGEYLWGPLLAVPLPNGRVVLFGKNNQGIGRGSIWDPVSRKLTVSPEPSMGVWAAVGLDDSRILIVGGQGASGKLATFDPDSGRIEMLGMTAGFAPTPVRLRDGRILLVGGLEDDQIHHPELGGLLAPGIDALQIFQ